MAKSKVSFVNIVFFVIFGVLTGVLWFYGSPIPLIPGAVMLRTFSFLAPAIGFLFGPVSGFFAGYIGTLFGRFWPAPLSRCTTPLADGITWACPARCPWFLPSAKGSG
jgi:energy-coupling factor transport system substrate-specific component